VRAFVLDASVVMAWFFKDETNALAEHVMTLVESCHVHVPYHWHAEIANSMIIGERKGRAEPAFVKQFSLVIDNFDILPESPLAERNALSLLPLARQHQLTIYDALYLDLAQRRECPIATLDKALARAAVNAGVTVLGDTV
jgi:predicted nucleic acid-binding protein